jgi:hypothetical protein
MTVPTGFAIGGSPITSSGTLALSFASGYSLPTTAKQTEWDSAYTFTSTFPSQGGNSGKYLTTDGNLLSWGTITPATIGAVPTSRQLTINGTAYDLSADRSWSVGTVTSVDVTTPTGLTVSGVPLTSSGTIAISLQSGYSIPPISKQTDWDTAYTFVAAFPSQTSNNNKYLKTDGTNPYWSALLPSDLTGAVPVDKGGTGVNTLTGVAIGDGTNAFTGISSTTGGQLFRVNLFGNGYEFFTDDYMTNPFVALGDIVFSNAAGFPIRRAGNTTTTKMYLTSTGDGTNPTAPVWEAITSTTIGAVPTTRTLTINDVPLDLSADRSWSVGDYGTW